MKTYLEATHLKVSYPNHHIVIKICDTPIANHWKNVMNDAMTNNIPMMTRLGLPFYHGDQVANVEKQSQAVKEINKAIEDVNRIIHSACFDGWQFTKGKYFPYHAYDDMPWQQTNLIHRCFTTGQIAQTTWQLNLTEKQKYDSKFINDGDVLEWVHSLQRNDFSIWNCWDEFSSANNRINKWIHIYEDSRLCPRAKNLVDKAVKNNKKTWSISIEPDVFNEDGRKWYEYHVEPEIEDILRSFPDDKDECDVTLMKSITGKDYFQCFQEYDDPTEWDIRNVGKIKGGFTFYPNNTLQHVLEEQEFQQWHKSYGLRPELVEPVPVGKIVEDTVHYESFTADSSALNSDNTWAITEKYRTPSFEWL